ncbi:MAG: purine-nucleoside phosphorylase [[Clostridium] cellulosi]|nr:MAG: purine-nucleoside phosphorylase [[Clostridium] cellulosi]
MVIFMNEALDYIRSKTDFKPTVGIILGSGLGKFAQEIVKPVTIPYRDIPHFPVSTVEGHKGCLVMGKVCGKNVVCMQGRFHYYEGYSMKQVVFPVYIMKQLGVRTLIVTNAAGAINKSFSPGDLMLISDHINLMGTNPLIGRNDDKLGPRFPSMTEGYSLKLRDIAKTAAANSQINLQEGVYAALTGPSYETPAEIRFLRIIGADAVGMSTVPEVIAANHCGMEVLGISCITNMASGVTEKPLDHDEVIETSRKASERFITLVKSVIALLN